MQTHQSLKHKDHSSTQLYIAKKLDQVIEQSPVQDKLPFVTGNIFQQKKLSNELLNQIGPRITRSGEVVKYTLVGKPEWFLKFTTRKGMNLDDTKLQMIKNLRKSEDDRQFFRPKVESLKKLDTDKKLKKSNIRTRSQLIAEVSDIQDKLMLNKTIEEKQLNKQDKVKILTQTRQQRILEKYQEYSQVWKNFENKISSRLGREDYQCQQNQGEQYRKKLELAQAIDIMKSDADRFGSKVWYMTLRQNETLSNNNNQKITHSPIVVTADLPDAFHLSTMGKTKANIEFIRAEERNISNNYSIKSQSSTLKLQQQPFQSFNSGVYLSQKISAFEQKFSKSTLMEFPTQLEHLMVEGKSKFDQEVNYLKQTPDKTMFKKININLDEIIGSDQESIIKYSQFFQDGEEVFAVNYSAKQKLYDIQNQKLPKNKIKNKLSLESSHKSFIHSQNSSQQDISQL